VAPANSFSRGGWQPFQSQRFEPVFPEPAAKRSHPPPQSGFPLSFEAGNCVPCTAVVEAVAVVVGAEEVAVAAEVEWSDSRAVLR